jgi:hypothetical protein
MAVVYGTVVGKDGKKLDGTIYIGTSISNKKTKPQKGKYRLEIGFNPKKEIYLLVNGKIYRRVYVNGDLCVNIHL